MKLEYNLYLNGEPSTIDEVNAVLAYSGMANSDCTIKQKPNPSSAEGMISNTVSTVKYTRSLSYQTFNQIEYSLRDHSGNIDTVLFDGYAVYHCTWTKQDMTATFNWNYTAAPHTLQWISVNGGSDSYIFGETEEYKYYMDKGWTNTTNYVGTNAETSSDTITESFDKSVSFNAVGTNDYSLVTNITIRNEEGSVYFDVVGYSSDGSGTKLTETVGPLKLMDVKKDALYDGSTPTITSSSGTLGNNVYVTDSDGNSCVVRAIGANSLSGSLTFNLDYDAAIEVTLVAVADSESDTGTYTWKKTGTEYSDCVTMPSNTPTGAGQTATTTSVNYFYTSISIDSNSIVYASNDYSHGYSFDGSDYYCAYSVGDVCTDNLPSGIISDTRTYPGYHEYPDNISYSGDYGYASDDTHKTYFDTYTSNYTDSMTARLSAMELDDDDKYEDGCDILVKVSCGYDETTYTWTDYEYQITCQATITGEPMPGVLYVEKDKVDDVEKLLTAIKVKWSDAVLESGVYKELDDKEYYVIRHTGILDTDLSDGKWDENVEDGEYTYTITVE